MATSLGSGSKQSNVNVLPAHAASLVLRDYPVLGNAPTVLNLDNNRAVSILAAVGVIAVGYEFNHCAGDVTLQEFVDVLASRSARVLDYSFIGKRCDALCHL